MRQIMDDDYRGPCGNPVLLGVVFNNHKKGRHLTAWERRDGTSERPEEKKKTSKIKKDGKKRTKQETGDEPVGPRPC